MFKARKKNPKHKGNLRRRSLEEDDNHDKKEEQGTTSTSQENDDEEDDTTSTLQTIARVKQKRKLLTELQYKKGTDVSELLKARHDNTTSNNHDHEEHAEGTAGLQDNNKEAAAQEGIMEQKHKQALEDYVEEQLATLVGDQQRNQLNAQQKAQLAEDLANHTANKVWTKEELYQELAQAAERMVGRNHSSSAETAAVKEGDVGTGGAMLVAGTGLAEVVLPVEERLKAVHATREASNSKNKNTAGEKMPKSQVPVPGGTSGRFYVPRVGNRDFMDKPVPEREVNSSSNNQQQQHNTPGDETETAMDSDRAGFEALRGKAGLAANNNNTGGGGAVDHGDNNKKRAYKNRASDDKVYGSFVKRQKEMRGRR